MWLGSDRTLWDIGASCVTIVIVTQGYRCEAGRILSQSCGFIALALSV